MTFIAYTLLSGIVSGILSIYFRLKELKEEIILMPRHLVTQIALFIIFALVFARFFSEVYIDLGFIKIGWLIIYIAFSSVSYYAVQVFYEFFSGNTLFPTEDEVKRFIEKLERERDQY